MFVIDLGLMLVCLLTFNEQLLSEIAISSRIIIVKVNRL